MGEASRTTRLSVESLAKALKTTPSEVLTARDAVTAREMEPNDWIQLDDPVEKLLWMLLLHNPKVTVNVQEGSVSGVDPKNRTIIDDLLLPAAREMGKNMDLIPTLQYDE